MMFRFSSVSLCDAKATSVAAEHNSSATTSMCNGHSLGAMSITMQPSVIQQKLFSKRRHLRQAMWPSSLSPTICTPSSVAKVGVRNFLNRENSDKWKMSAAFATHIQLLKCCWEQRHSCLQAKGSIRYARLQALKSSRHYHCLKQSTWQADAFPICLKKRLFTELEVSQVCLLVLNPMHHTQAMPLMFRQFTSEPS